jgi:predicted PurR-regulated permease PerM
MKIQNTLVWIITGILILGLLYVGKKLLIPFVLAIFIWYLINVLTAVYGSVSIRKFHLPKTVCFLLSIVTIYGILSFLIGLITDNITDVVKLAPEYQKNLANVVHKIFNVLPIQEPPTLNQIIGTLKVGTILSQFTRTLTGMVGNAGIILVYLIFLFLEQKSFKVKLRVLIKDPEQQRDVFKILQKIDADTRKYIGIKTFTSALTAILAYVVLSRVGLDFAEFWAIMIFVFNYIPTIGSFVATIFPSILSLVQFDSFYPFLIVFGGLTILQFLIGSLLDPKLMGNSLNLSPIVIILSLLLWGFIWGVTGMILCVPIMAILMIILSHFNKTRPIAIFLSKDGNLSPSSG